MGLRLDNEVVRIAVGLRLSLPLCRPHRCIHCGAEVDDRGTHGLSCRFSKGHHPRHGAVNDVVKRSLEAAKIGGELDKSHPRTFTGQMANARMGHPLHVPWKGGGVLVWDATCPDTLAPSYSALATRKLGQWWQRWNEERG